MNATGLYKFTSVEVNLEQRKQTINRETYDLLQWLGDLGGLMDALYYILLLILRPFTSFRLSGLLLSSLFRISLHSHETTSATAEDNIEDEDAKHDDSTASLKNKFTRQFTKRENSQCITDGEIL